ncbi:MAG: hypothetical protein ACP5N1_02670 [Candidatus Woesearchaeota archaeon]
MQKKSIMIIYISKDSIDYDLVLNYLRVHSFITHLSIIPEGFLVRMQLNQKDRRKLIGTIIDSEVTNIKIHELLHEEDINNKRSIAS